jgi:hypothetical protein
VITLADAVVHLLLVISENSMEDPECCRQFIRLVIGLLKNRVSSTVNTEQPSTSHQDSASSDTSLMNLPLPVLLLIKSLLRGVSRCQIFVDEGGKATYSY